MAEIWINRALGTISEREVLRVFRNRIGDWCAEVVISGRVHIAVLDHHPRAVLLRMLRNSGTDIADDIVAQGAEGMDVRPAHTCGGGAQRHDALGRI